MCRHKTRISYVGRWEKHVSVRVEDVCAVVEVSIKRSQSTKPCFTEMESMEFTFHGSRVDY